MAGCICWLDEVNRIGLFEPVGTSPMFRRRGLATALMPAGMARLRQKGAQDAMLTALNPGLSGDRIPVDFTSSRRLFQSVGFGLVRQAYLFVKDGT